MNPKKHPFRDYRNQSNAKKEVERDFIKEKVAEFKAGGGEIVILTPTPDIISNPIGREANLTGKSRDFRTII